MHSLACPMQVRLLSRYGSNSAQERVSCVELGGYLEQVSSILNESFPHIQSQMEGFLEKFRREVSSLMHESIVTKGCQAAMVPGNALEQSIRLIRDLYFLGNSDIFLQLDHSIFHRSLNTDGSLPTHNANICDQFEFISVLWKELLASVKLNCGTGSSQGISNSKVCLCSDTFDLFNSNLSQLELVDLSNCRLSDNALHLGGKPSVHVDSEPPNSDDAGRESGGGAGGLEAVEVASACRIKWPIRIIDGFNHVLECVSSADVVSSLLFAASDGVPLGGGEFLRFTWSFGFKDRRRQTLEFRIRLYWHTRNLKSLLNTERDHSLLKTSVLEVPSPSLIGSARESLLYVYRLRVLFRQSNISVYVEPLKSNPAAGSSSSLFGKPTQVLSIQHINIDICLPLQTSSCYIHLLRHVSFGDYQREREFGVVKWCHVSSSNSSDVISQLAGSGSGVGSSSDTGSGYCYNYNLLDGVSLNSYLSGVSFDQHVFRLRLTQRFDWPLPLLFTKKNMEHYYNLFDFYWLFFRTYNGLERVWREAFNLRYGNRRGVFFSFFVEHPVNHFWNYIFYCRWVLQVTIGEYYSFLQHFAVDQSFRDFLDVVRSERDFESIIQRHGELVQTLTLKSGFLLPSILNPLTSILILTSEWSHKVYREILRWNDLSELAESELLFQDGERVDSPWQDREWASLIEDTLKFMNSFVLLWDSLCSEVSIVSSNIQYQHLNFLLSIFNNNKWNIDIPDLSLRDGRALPPLSTGCLYPSHLSSESGDEEYRVGGDLARSAEGRLLEEGYYERGSFTDDCDYSCSSDYPDGYSDSYVEEDRNYETGSFSKFEGGGGLLDLGLETNDENKSSQRSPPIPVGGLGSRFKSASMQMSRTYYCQ